jgi:signal transduction histidine kinase
VRQPTDAAVAHRPDAVLVVDDEPANQRTLRRALSDEWEVLTAGGGEEGLCILRTHAVDLVIADQRMPGMSGVEFLEAVAGQYPDVVRVVLTAYADVPSLTDAINQGRVYHFLHKPWDAFELRHVVRRGLEKRAAEAERRRLLSEVEAACDRLRREAEQKTRLLAKTTHELGTPVHILINALDLLDDELVPEKARPWLGAARRAGSWLARVVAQLNTAAQVRCDSPARRNERFELAGLIEDLLDRLREGLGARRIEIAVFLAARTARVEGDRDWIRHAVWGLLSNAVRFTPDGGRVEVELREEAGLVALSVSDSGIGIAEERLGEIFEPFSGAAGDPYRHGSGFLEFGARGLGLGLALVKEVATAHGGELSVHSRVGDGSRFTLHLPRWNGTGDDSWPR